MSEFIIGEEYEFSNDGDSWVKGELIRCTAGIITDYHYIKGLDARFTYIRGVKSEQPKPSSVFNLERALVGDKVTTRNGCEVTQITPFNVTDKSFHSIACLIDGELSIRTSNGCSVTSDECDLVMAPKMLKGFVGFTTHGAIYGNSKEEVEIAASDEELKLKAIIDLSTIEEGHGL